MGKGYLDLVGGLFVFCLFGLGFFLRGGDWKKALTHGLNRESI